MNKLTAFILLFLISFSALSQKNLTEGTKLLFHNIKTTLSTSEKNEVFENAGLVLSRDKKQFVMAGDVVFLDHPFDAKVFPVDLNNDGKEEIFLVFGNDYTSGESGSNVLLFIKDKTGKYQTNFGFSGTAPVIMPTKNSGYPDLLIGGPGNEFPIWRWNGKEYSFYKKIAAKNLAKMKTVRVAEASQLYVNNIRQ